MWVGGRAEPAMRRAVRYGNGWLPYLFRPSHYARSYETVGNLLVDSDRNTENFGWGLHLMTAIEDTREKSVEMAAAGLRAGYRYDGDYEALAERYCLLGPADEAAQTLREFEKAGAEDILLSWIAPAERLTEQITVAGTEILPLLG